MAAPDAAHWQRLSPLLDALLDAPAAERPARLAAIAADDAALAAELQALLDEHGSLEARGFLEAGALPPPPGLAGQRIGAYTLERLLGEGGMGQVWLARRTDGRFEGMVAIKLLRGGLRTGAERERFAAEGRILGRLDHPHIARLLDAGVGDDGAPYLVIEYVDGEPVDRHVERLAPPLERRIGLLIDACDAVAHAHARLILHRDLKPSNVMVRADGQLKLLDFGIAKLLDAPADGGSLTARVGAAFTPRYAAPEQQQREDVTTATDVYALGVLMFGLLGGGHPTADDGASPLEQLRALVERPPRRLSEQARRAGAAPAWVRALRGDLDTIAARALAKRPAERYANAADLAEDLRRWRGHQPIRARPDRWWYRSLKFVRRNRVGVGAGALALAAVLGGAGVALQQAHDAQARRREAEGLVEFMLGDLRRKLQPVGRLDVMDVVGARALAYYAAQELAALDADALGRRARALHLIGEIAERRGQLDEAARRFDSAAASTAELLARAPADPQRLFDHAQSEYWVGFIARRRGSLAEAEAAMRRYLALAERLEQLAAARPDAPLDWQAERPYAQQNLGVLLIDRGRPREALGPLQAATDGLQALARRQPELGEIVPVTMGWLSRAREHVGDLGGALAAREASLALMAAPAPGAPDSNAAYDRAMALLDIGNLRLSLGQAAAALAAFDPAVELLQQLVQRDAANLDWAGQLGATWLFRAEARAAMGRPVAADLAAASATLAPLWRANPDKRYWQVRLRGHWLAAQCRHAPATTGLDALLDGFVDAVERSEAAHGALDADQSAVLAQVLLARGDRRAGRGERAAAERDWRESLARLAPRAREGHPEAQALLASAHDRLGEAQAARLAAERLASTPYRHPLYAELIQRLGPAGGAGPR